MKILITGAFGNVGKIVLNQAIERGDEVSVFELKNKKNIKISKKYGKVNKVIWGDITNYEDVFKAIDNVDVVIHMAAIIPPLSEKNWNLCKNVNFGGTKNIISAIKSHGNKCKMVFVSSASVMGETQKKEPPVHVYDELQATDNYTKSKIMAEKLVQDSGVNYCITRLGGVMLTKELYDFNQIVYSFSIPLKTRMELVLDIDVATALCNAGKLLYTCDKINNKKFFIGGGKEKGFQIYNKNFINEVFNNIGLKAPKEECFVKEKEYFIDWLDTTESQYYLNYQNHSMEYFYNNLKKQIGIGNIFIKLFSTFITKYIESKSPYNTQNKVIHNEKLIDNN